ncbi:DJ-1/PfpI family protein [Methanochimaera problematica]|nr:DJ-1/PfpI family protein [Methanoplanus sp. FWC-SCC4]
MVIAPKRYREEEFEIPAKMFEEAGIEYEVASVESGECYGIMGGIQNADIAIRDADETSYDALVIVGGLGASDFLWSDDDLKELTEKFGKSGKVTAAICLAPVVLARAGLLKGRQATVFESPATLKLLEEGGANYVKIGVVADMNIITANHPTASAEFAETIIEKLTC